MVQVPEILPPYQIRTPDYVSGMSISVAPMSSKHARWMHDYEYYDQLGRDPFQQRKIWGISDPQARAEVLKEILEEFPKQMHRLKLLLTASRRGDEVLVRCLVETGMRVHPDFEKAKREEEIKAADDDEKDDELENGGLPDLEDTSAAPVHLAVVFGRLNCLKIFIESGVDVNLRDEFGRTLLLAAAGDQLEIIRYLLAQGAVPTARSHVSSFTRKYLGDFAGSDALEIMAFKGNAEVLATLLEDPGVQVTPLAITTAAGGSYEALQLLLERGGYHPKNENKDKLISEEQRQTIIDATRAAVDGGDLASLKLLLSYQYPLDKNGNFLPFEVPEDQCKRYIWGAYTAITRNQVEKFEFIHNLGLKEHDTMSLDPLPEGQMINIQHLLEEAAQSGAIDSVRLLTDKYGADPNKYRMPPAVLPLYWAAANDKPEMVRYLLENFEVDIHKGNGLFAAGPTALWVAVELKSLESVSILLQHGGPLDHIDDDVFAVTEPTKAVLLDRGARVEFKLEANVDIERMRNNFQRPNSPYVRLVIGPEDKAWISKLQLRRSAEELRETGTGARELNKDEAAKLEDLDQEDTRRILAALPTIESRAATLNEDDDLLPRFKPAFKPVT